MKFLLASCLAAGVLAGSLQAAAQITNPMTKAVIQVYTKAIQENPADYDSFFRRANEYYSHSEYMRALDDVNHALQYIPSTDTDLKIQALALRASIYEVTDRPMSALDDLRQASALIPDDYVMLYRKANAEMENGNYQQAKADYQRLSRLNQRSTEALVGQARVAIKQNNLGLATELIDQAVALDTNNPELYVRRASVRADMGNPSGAVDDLLLALSIDSRNVRATQRLIDMSKDNYAAVVNGLTSAIRQAPNVGMFYYIRAVIAQAHFHYGAAIADFDKIIADRLYDYHGLYASLAECYYALGDYIRALQNIDRAMGMVRDVAPYYILKSKILLAQGDSQEALTTADQAVFLAPDDVAACIQKGLCLVGIKDYQGASDMFGEATLTDASDPMYNMLRAWVCGQFLNQPVAAEGFYRTVADLERPDQDVSSLRGFAQLFLGQRQLALDWMADILANVPDTDGLIHYYGACLYAQAGETDKALDCVRGALERGYANRYDWTINQAARISVEPLRPDTRFRQLLEEFDSIFTAD